VVPIVLGFANGTVEVFLYNIGICIDDHKPYILVAKSGTGMWKADSAVQPAIAVPALASNNDTSSGPVDESEISYDLHLQY
jgi:hypothetical protein